MKKLLLLTCLTPLLASCATMTMSTKDIAQYKALSVNDFIVERFVKSEQHSVTSSITKSLDFLGTPQNRVLEKFDKDTTGLLDDGKSVSFKASFNDVNYVQLLRPSRELSSFCTTQNGVWTAVNLNTKNFISEVTTSPFEAYFNAYKRNYSGYTTVNLPFGSISYTNNTLKPLFAKVEASLIAEYNRAYGINDAINGYGYARRKEAFGLFKCVDTNTQNAKWYVSISPFIFMKKVKANNDLLSPSLKILITPIQPSEIKKDK